ncbi:MAG: hypothetical protein GY768_21935 [Planctomycetaceae bacterium]|nr:hypothetical protein [Planctomycetaceae bacterium]
MDYRLPALTAGLLVAAFGIARGLSSENPPVTAAQAIPQSLARTGEKNEPDGQQQAGSRLIANAISRLSSHQTISAKVRHRTQIFDQRLVGSGLYLQKRAQPDPLVRFSLSVQSGERAVSLLHICDGRFLWIRENLDPPASLSRIDLRRIRHAGQQDGSETILYPMTLGGGIVQLLKSLQANFDFSEPYPLTFQKVPVWSIDCRWKPHRLKKLLPKKTGMNEAGKLKVSELPPQLPDHVFLLFGQDDLFPYHIDFRRSRSEDPAKEQSDQKSTSLVTMELFEVQFDASIQPSQFVYKPGDIEITDGTDEYIARLQKFGARKKQKSKRR